MRRQVWLTAALVLGAAALSGGATYGYYRALPPGRSLPGTWVGGRLQPAGEALGDWLERRRVALSSEPAYLHASGESFQLTYGKLGLELDVGATMAAVRDHATRGSFQERMGRAYIARKYDTELALVWSYDRERARVAVEKLAAEVYRDPIDARLDLVGHLRIADEPGAELDVEATLDAIEQGERGELPVFELRTRPVAARVTSAMLLDVDVTSVLSAFETDFGGTGEGRATNIRVAAHYLNGRVIAPGQTFSFNDVVGARTFERGFALAPVIIDDELDTGIGGGVCQVASTLHAASVYGALDVVQRRSHSRPSAYAKVGLDATVIWGEVDLKLRNPYPTPIIVHAFLPSATHLRIELLGREPPGEVKYEYGVSKTYDFFRRVTTKPWLGDRSVKRQKGRRGMDVVSIVRVLRADGHIDQRYYRSEYRPVPEVFWVGPENDHSALPELPEGAEHVEVDGVAQTAAAPAAAGSAAPGGERSGT